MPLSVDRLTGLLAQAMVPTMIVTLGVHLSSIEKLELNLDIWIACGLSLLLAPLLVFGLASLFPLGELEKKYWNFASSYVDTNPCCDHRN